MSIEESGTVQYVRRMSSMPLGLWRGSESACGLGNVFTAEQLQPESYGSVSDLDQPACSRQDGGASLLDAVV